MGSANDTQIIPRVWKDEEFGVLPIFCFNEPKHLGDHIALHFFEPRYLRLLNIVSQPTNGLWCFIYACTGHPQADTTAFICTINERMGSDIRATMTKMVKINQSWIDKTDRLWWCRFQVAAVNIITPLTQVSYSQYFKSQLEHTDSRIPPALVFFNDNLEFESRSCEMYYNLEIKMYSAVCTPTTKAAIIDAALNRSDPEYESLRRIPRSTIWYLLPEKSETGLMCNDMMKWVESEAKDISGSVTKGDLISSLVELDVACVKKIRVMNAKAQIIIGEDMVVRCPMSQHASRVCAIAIVDFGITKGNFIGSDVTLTTNATQQVFRQVSLMVNRERLKLIYEGHICEGSPLRKIPTQLIEQIVLFLLFA